MLPCNCVVAASEIKDVVSDYSSDKITADKVLKKQRCDENEKQYLNMQMNMHLLFSPNLVILILSSLLTNFASILTHTTLTNSFCIPFYKPNHFHFLNSKKFRSKNSP
jgi:hypothetical protein